MCHCTYPLLCLHRSPVHLVKNKLPNGVDAIYQIDGKLFNLSYLKSKTKTVINSLIEHQYADGNAIVATSEGGTPHYSGCV